jgi:hypothetical protein
MKRAAGVYLVPLLISLSLACLSGCSRNSAQHFLRRLDAQSSQLLQSFQSAHSAEAAQTTQPVPSAPVAKPAKSSSHAKKPDPKPEPTQDDLVEYVRGKLLGLSPSDGFNDNVDVAFDPATETLTVTRPDGRCLNFLDALNANSMVWDLFDPGDTHNQREPLLRLTITSMSGKAARTCYDKWNRPDKEVALNRARFLFSTSKVDESPGFQSEMTKAFKKLIALSGGTAEKKLF